MKAENLLRERNVLYCWPSSGMKLPPDMKAFNFKRFKDGRQIGASEEIWVLGSYADFLNLLDCWNQIGGGTWTYMST